MIPLGPDLGSGIETIPIADQGPLVNITPEAPDLGTGIETIPVGDQGPLVNITPEAPDLGTGIETIPVADQSTGQMVKASEAGAAADDNIAAWLQFMKGQLGEGPTRTFQTYVKKNSETGKIYAGMTSGYGTPLENVVQRDYGHAYNDKGYGPAQLDRSSANEDAIKGREQMLIDYFDSQGISGNDDKNPWVTNRESYIQQAI
jgi:hypothetical protein